MTRLIRQRIANDCVICSVAMFAGKSYGHVARAAGELFDPENGVVHHDRLLERLGLLRDVDFMLLCRGILDPDFFRRFAWGRRALLTVPSLNAEGGFHLVYWDGRAVHDPSRNRRYVCFDQLKPEEIIMFRETRA